MHKVKICRIDNRNVITLPPRFEAAGYVSGASVIIEETDAGELLIMPEDRLEDRINEIGRRVIDEDREAHEMLAAYDRGEINADGEPFAIEQNRNSMAST